MSIPFRGSHLNLEAAQRKQMEAMTLSTTDIARELGRSVATVRRYCRDGIIPGIKIGRSWVVRRDKWMEFFESQGRESWPSAGQPLEPTATLNSQPLQIPLVTLVESDIEYALKNINRPEKLERSAIARYVDPVPGQSAGTRVQTLLHRAFELLKSQGDQLNEEEKRLVDYLDKRYRQGWQVEPLSAEYRLSREYLTRRYRRPAIQMYLQAIMEIL